MTTLEIEGATDANHVDPFVVEQRLRPLMGTLCAIEARGPADSTRNAISAAFAVMTHVEQCMHPTRVTSDIARLNGSTHRRVKLDATTWEVLAVAHRLHALSNGVFDPCLPSQPGCLRDLELLPDTTAVCHSPLAIDLGGIAKGYAIDQAISALQRAGCTSGLVNAGGDLRAFGELPRHILIRMNERQTANLTLRDAALAVSEVTTSNHPPEHQGYYLRNTDLAPAHKQAAVLAEQAIIADALTKCVMFCTNATLDAMFGTLNATRVLADGNSHHL